MRKKGWFNPSHKNSAGFSDDVHTVNAVAEAMPAYLQTLQNGIGTVLRGRSGAVGSEITRMRKFKLLA